MKVEKLNKARVTAIKMTPAYPRWYCMAVCKRSMPVRPLVSSSGASSMIMAVQLQITMVSIRTPSDWVRPVRTGSLLWAAAAAQGAEPEPASLENRPRLTPFIRTAPKPPDTA